MIDVRKGLMQVRISSRKKNRSQIEADELPAEYVTYYADKGCEVLTLEECVREKEHICCAISNNKDEQAMKMKGIR